MGKTIRQLQSGLTIGNVKLGVRAGVTGSVKQEVHDGDTIVVRSKQDDNFSVRFLGIDTPEISFKPPTSNNFLGIGREEWKLFLQDPFASHLPPFSSQLDPALENHITSISGTDTASNHIHYAREAEDELESLVDSDMADLGQDKDSFEFFLIFSKEVMDGYGRFLCFINRNQPNSITPSPRPLSYNERLLESGLASPYFIWPNVSPFGPLSKINPADLVPATFRNTTSSDSKLSTARGFVSNARTNHLGIFDAANPLLMQPFELRFLAGRNPPHRWVIDLSKNDNTLIKPQNYFTIPNLEDRLYIPPEYVPLFVEAGWQRQP